MKNKNYFVAVNVMLLLITSGVAGAADYFVSPQGNDHNSGRHWEQPFRSVQRALQAAQAGDRIKLAAGEYWEDIRSVRSGAPEAPIWIVGSSGATLKGAGAGRMVQINHSHIVLMNLTVDGRIGAGKRSEDYRDKLIYIMGRDRAGVTGVKLIGMELRNAGGECVRLKYFAHHNEIAHSRILNCGVWDFRFKQGGKNGEGVYIGTAPEQRGRNPSRDPDASNGNWVHHNYFDTRGNECVDIKESARYNVVEHNECTGQQDPNSAGLNARGSHNIFRFNLVWGNKGAGVRLGGDSARDGIHNEVYGNTLLDNDYSGLKIMAAPQGAICGNTIRPIDDRLVRGKHADGVDPLRPCSN